MGTFAEIAPPDFLIIAVLILGIERGAANAQFSGFFVGAIVDLLASGRVGPTAAAYCVAGHLGGRFAARFGARFLTMMGAIPVSIVLAEITAGVIARIGNIPMNWNATDLLLRIVSALAVAPLIYFWRRPLGLGRRS